MNPRGNAFSSSVVEKLLVAVTGLALCAYLVVHLAGNTLVFLGPRTFNGYAHVLISSPLVIPVEIGLLAVFVLHVWKTVALWWRNRGARPQPYVRTAWAGGASRKSWASTTMIYTGALTAIFVVLHVRAFKYGPAAEIDGQRDLYGLLVGFFADPLHVALYEVCLVLVGFHLWHGFASAFESLGLDEPRLTPRLLVAGKVLAALIAGGFVAIPLWAFFLGGRP
jgi:succinate dehydrogenase / fumarate reductase, cytochrome b subunit